MHSHGSDRRPGQPQGEKKQPSAFGSPLELSSGDLFRGNREVLIEHNGEAYRLRITRTGKLILNK